MVGVPTSKGCRLCLKRSVKCDETRPSCLQCQRGGRTCPGYVREFKFHDEGPKIRRNLSRNLNNTGDVSHSMLSTRKNSHLFLPEQTATGELNLSNEHLLSTDILSQTQFDTASLHRPIPSSLEHEQLLSSFVSIVFPLGDISVQSSFLGSWLWHVPPRFGRNVALDHAAMSLAYAYFGGTSQSQFLLRTADLFYSRALRSLTKAIADHNKRLSPEVLCATLLLGYYEVLTLSLKHTFSAANIRTLFRPFLWRARPGLSMQAEQHS
ncbi:hypothetical protein N7523_009524 [Penicillium sp. IBT 18751x]|nr:hypothetical protein N7523_009524 [Penicillium sp. IBT 18751x]